jgi:hypothetical protein
MQLDQKRETLSLLIYKASTNHYRIFLFAKPVISEEQSAGCAVKFRRYFTIQESSFSGGYKG